MNLLIVFAFAGDSTMTRFLAIAERPKLVRRRRNSSRVHHARAYAGRRIDRAADDNTATSGRRKTLLAVEFRRLRVVIFFVSAAGSLVLFRLVVERLVRDAEDLGGLAAIAIGHGERLFDDDALHLFHRLAERDHDAVARAAFARAEELVGEAFDGEAAAAGHDERAIDHVAQLADVARPLVLLQRLDEVGFDRLDLLLLGLVQLLQEEVREKRDVF